MAVEDIANTTPETDTETGAEAVTETVTETVTKAVTEAVVEAVTETVTMAVAAAGPYPVAPGYNVNVRSGPGTQYRVVRTLPKGARVTINCQKPGQTVTGPYGTTKIWDNIGVGEYISDAYVRTGSDGYVAARCA